MDLNKGYLQLSTTWYGDVCLKKLGREEEIRFGFYEPNGNTAGEMIMIWEKAKDEVLTKLVVFGDSWSALADLQDLIDLLGKHGDNPLSPTQFIEYLKQCGFTERRMEM